MNILQLRKLIKSILLILLTFGMVSCKAQDGEKKVVEIFSGIKIENDLYTHSEESIFEIGEQKYSLRARAFYASDGSITKLFLYKSEGTLEYGKDKILKDKNVLDYTGFPFKQSWFYENNQLINKTGEIIEIQEADKKILKSEKDGRITFYKIN